MTNADDPGIAVVDDPAIVIGQYLKHDDALIRCAAAKALRAKGDVGAAPAMVAALLDEDPDMRTDAMEALVRCARPEDAATILHSLEGDPIKEVKIFAIEALTRLEEPKAVPLLRALAKDRAANRVAWEDDAGMWDDWLDVQVAAIKALGWMQASEAIDDLLDARTDEMGQELDNVIFAALAMIEDGGIAALFGLLRYRDSRVRERALKALTRARPEALAPMREILLRDDSPAIRRLAIGGLDPESPSVANLARQDPNEGVRRAALSAFAHCRPDIALAALGDRDEGVRAIALQAVAAKAASTLSSDVVANVQAWMETAGAHLAATAATELPKLIRNQACEPLRRVAMKTDRPLEVRIAALQALGDFPSNDVLKTLRELAVDRIKQVRTGALAALAKLSKHIDQPIHQTTTNILIDAVRSGLDVSDQMAPAPGQEGVMSLGASKVEDDTRHITISPDGDIISVEIEPGLEDHRNGTKSPAGSASNIVEGYFPKSTLDAIQARPTPDPGEDQTPPEPDDKHEPAKRGQRGRKRRVAVDGPDDVALDIRLIALNMIADCPGQSVDQALAEMLDVTDASIRIAAFKAIAQRSETMAVTERAITTSVAALADPEPAIRGYAACIIGQSLSPGAATQLVACLDDPDATTRAEALKAVALLSPDKAIAGLRDPSTLVRRIATNILLSFNETSALDRGLDICLEQDRTDTLAEICKNSPYARLSLVSTLCRKHLPRRQMRTALETLALI